NYCDAPILSNTIDDELIFNSSYYHIGHFSKFVKPNAFRIFSETNNNLIKQIAFENPDGTIILVVLNESEEDIYIDIKLKRFSNGLKAKKRSITTVILEENE
ncbi:MAG: glycoside hydrolase family 30 protein, partial [Candidatus Izemoplasmatales bacterium]